MQYYGQFKIWAGFESMIDPQPANILKLASSKGWFWFKISTSNQNGPFSWIQFQNFLIEPLSF